VAQQCRQSRLWLLAFILTLGNAAVAPVHAQQFPTRPVKIVLGFPPGSTPDIVVRTAADKMAEDLGQAVLIDNRPGASGMIASEAVARSPADGYTLTVDGCSATGIVYAFVMAGRPPLDPFKDFTPVGRVMRDHWLVVSSPALGVKSLPELVALGKAKPGALNFPSSGVGSSQHLQSERFRQRVAIDATHVPYKDNYIPDLIAGRMSFTVQGSAALTNLVKSGKLTGLAVLSTERMAALPNVPTSAEVGMPDLVYNAGVCLYAPGGTPPDIVLRLNAALNKAEAAETVKQRFAELGVETVHGTPEETARYIGQLMAEVDRLRVLAFGKAR
jgi:tripartite-type tricarboxylate transporter receptor subunit TctC